MDFNIHNPASLTRFQGRTMESISDMMEDIVEVGENGVRNPRFTSRIERCKEISQQVHELKRNFRRMVSNPNLSFEERKQLSKDEWRSFKTDLNELLQESKELLKNDFSEKIEDFVQDCAKNKKFIYVSRRF